MVDCFDINFVNATYWGIIDKDELQYYKRLPYYHIMDEIVAVIPNDKINNATGQLIAYDTDNILLNDQITSSLAYNRKK